MPATTQPPATQPIIGQPVSRYDGRDKVMGSARYAADFPLKKLTHAVAFHSRIASGRVASIDADAARKMPGVLAVLTHENVQKLYKVSLDHKTGKPGQTFLPMQGDDIRYAGQYLGVVVAETLDQARHAADTIVVTYADEKRPAAKLDDNEDKTFVPQKLGEKGDKPTSKRGDPETAFAAAAIKVDQQYATPPESHNPIEMSATIASWAGPKLTLHDATQYVFGVKGVISTWLGIPADDVQVRAPFLGGGFGCKGSIWPHEVLAALAAKQVGRPVKLVLTRAQMFFGIGHRPPTVQRVRLGADAGGKLTSILHDCGQHTSINADEWMETATLQTKMLYSCPNVGTSQTTTPINVNTPCQMRAPGHATGTFALEVAMDELAEAAKIDPVDLRLLNYADTDEGEKAPFSSKALKDCYEQAAERFGWAKRDPKVGAMRDGEWLVGYGMATATYPTNQADSSAQVQLLANGNAVVAAAGHDIGTGAYTILQQIAAETLGLPIDKVRVALGDTTLPEAPVAGGSQTSASVGSAVLVACKHLIGDLKERAHADELSPLKHVAPNDIALGDGRIFLAKDPSVGEPIVELMRRNGGRPLVAKATVIAGVKGSSPDAGSGSPVDRVSKHAWGAQFVEVHVNPRLGEIKVVRMVGAFAAGRILNAKTARSQLLGGMVWGLSMALHEATVFDERTAKVVNDNLADYLVPVNADVHDVEVVFVDEKDKDVNPLGVKGIGELGITGMAAAISNAIYHATGKRLRELPITPDFVVT